jgi:hypothetical protein
MYDFVESLLYSKNVDVSFTEKIAGQHMTIEIENGEVYVATKDNASDRRSARNTRFNRPITSAIASWVNQKGIKDARFQFEVVHPKHNHDFIKYKNPEIVAVEYTGALTTNEAKEINAFCKGCYVLSKDAVIPTLKQEAKDELRKWWEGGFKRSFQKLRPHTKGRYYYGMVNKLRSKLIKIISAGFASAIDDVTPVEGVVGQVRGKSFKLQGSGYLGIQRVQLPFYSLIKLNKDEIDLCLQNPQKSFSELRTMSNLPFESIYSRNENKSFEETIFDYLNGNKKLGDVEETHYNRWFSEQETDQMISDINSGAKSLGDVYFEIRRKAKKPNQ